jgi:hypothetical protein
MTGNSNLTLPSPGLIERLPNSRFKVASTCSSGGGKPEPLVCAQAGLPSAKLKQFAAKPATAAAARRKARRLKPFALLLFTFLFI